MNTVIQDEIVLVANNKNVLRRQCNSDGPKNVMPKMPLCISIVTNRFTFSIVAIANSKFMITYFLREPNNTTIMIILFAKIPAIQIATLKVVKPGSADLLLLYFKIFSSKNMNELFGIMLSLFVL